MLTATAFHDLVSGRRRGLSAMLIRGALRAAEAPYRFAIWWRNRGYDTGSLPAHSAGVPVVSVGNLTLGGTGKTPMVKWIARWFRERNVRVTIVSRGYKAPAGGRNDEALELEQELGDVPHIQNPDRVAAARMAVEEFDCQLILLDDGFQHRRLARNIDLVLLDALEPFGFEHVFPRGALREPPESLARAQAVALSRADLVSADERRAIRQRVAQLAPQAIWLEARHQPTSLIAASGTAEPLETYHGRRVVAFCGIGNPEAFRRTLAQCGYADCELRALADHFDYQRPDVEALADWAESEHAEVALCTHKDLVKLGSDSLGRCKLRAVKIGLEINAGREAFESLLLTCCPAVATTGPNQALPTA